MKKDRSGWRLTANVAGVTVSLTLTVDELQYLNSIVREKISESATDEEKQRIFIEEALKYKMGKQKE